MLKLAFVVFRLSFLVVSVCESLLFAHRHRGSDLFRSNGDILRLFSVTFDTSEVSNTQSEQRLDVLTPNRTDAVAFWVFIPPLPEKMVGGSL